MQPPRVELGFRRIASSTYAFDVSETVVMNAGAKIINVQWDFDYGDRFSSTPGYSFVRGGKTGPELQTRYEFPSVGSHHIACKFLSGNCRFGPMRAAEGPWRHVQSG